MLVLDATVRNAVMERLLQIEKLRIDDYSEDQELRSLIRAYNDLLTDYIARQGHRFFLHSRDYF